MTRFSCRLLSKLIVAVGCLATANVHAQEQNVDVFTISVPEQANATFTFAAAELSKYFKAMTGRDYPVVGEGKGNNAPLVRLKVDSSLNHDGYRIYRDGQSIGISGGSPRGCLYGAYAFLNELGCRWPLPGKDYELVPRIREISCSGSTMESSPAFAGRSMMLASTGALEEILELIDWLAKNRFNCLCLHGTKIPSAIIPRIREALAARDMGLEWGGHWLSKYLPRDLFKEHPEYFRMENGKRTAKLNMCPSSAGAADVIAKNSMADWEELRSFPRFEGLHLIPDDLTSGGWCSCEKCKGLTASDQVLKITNEVARRLPLGKTPLAYVSYHETIYPPKNIKPGPNVRFICGPRERCYRHAIDACPLNREYLGYMEKQVQMFPNEPEVVEYYHDMILYRTLPMPLHPIIGKDAEAYRKAGVSRMSSLSFVRFSQWAYGPNYYVLGKSLWRGKGDSGDISEYCDAVYGPRAKEMRRYFDLLFEFCGAVMQLCGYDMGADMRHPPDNQPYTKTHVALLAPLLTREHLDGIEGILKEAMAGAAEPYRTRIENQLLLWQFARIEVPTVYRTMLAGYLNANLGQDATDTDRLYIIALIREVFQDMDKASEILLSAPAQLRGPLARDQGIMMGRFRGFKKPVLSHWMRKLEEQQKGAKPTSKKQQKQ